MSAIPQQGFDTLITPLLNTYNSQTTAHAGFLIALAVGAATIFFQRDFMALFANKWRKRFVFLYLPLGIVSGLSIYFILRTIYWSWMGSQVLAIPNSVISNGTSTAYGVEKSLIDQLVNQTVGWSSLSYTIDQKYFAASLSISIGIMLLLILALDFAFVHRVAYTPKWGIDKWHNFQWVISIVIIVLILLVFYPPFITPVLQKWINPNFQIDTTPLMQNVRLVGIGMVLFVIILVFGYFVKVGIAPTVKTKLISSYRKLSFKRING